LLFLRKDSRFSHNATVALQHRARKLRQLVEEKYAAVRQCSGMSLELSADFDEVERERARKRALSSYLER